MRKFNHIAALIKKKRLSHPQGLSQSDLSHLLGYKNGQFISNVERALCNIPFKMMNKVCDILQILPGEIRQAMLDDYEDTINAYLASNTGLDAVATNPAEEKVVTHTINNGFSNPAFGSTTNTNTINPEVTSQPESSF